MKKNFVLFVDDDDFLRKTMQNALKHEQYELILSKDAEAVVDLIKKYSPKVIILDLNMPIFSGIDVLKAIKPTPESPFSVILLTGSGSDSKMNECYELGIETFLRKPFNLLELKTVINKNLREHELKSRIKDARKNLEEKEKHYRLLVENQRDIFLEIDANNHFVFVSPSFSKVFNTPAKKLIGNDFLDFLPKNERIKATQTLKKLQYKPFEEYFEHWLDVCGKKQCISWSFKTIFDENSRYSGFVGVGRDLTQQRLREIDLENSKNFISQILDSIPEPIFVKDKNNNIVKTNKAYSELFTQNDKKNQAKLKSPHIIWDNKKENSFKNEMEGTFTDSNKIVHILSLKETPLDIPSENVVSVGIFHDITEKRKHDEQRNLKNAGEIANKSKSQFFSKITHELRTPINGVIGMLDLLGKTKLDEKQIDYTNTIKSSANSLMTILNNILDISKIEADLINLKDETFDFANLAEDIIYQYQTLANNKNIELISKVDQKEYGQVTVDQKRIQQLLRIFIDNAIKFTQNGTVVVETRIKEIKGQAFITASITDTGIGIKEDLQGIIFEKFAQEDSTAIRNFGGSGLSLAISKRIIEKMNGNITFKSKENNGSTFFFEIPVKLNKSIKRKISNNDPLHESKILIVDSNVLSAQTMVNYLKNWKVNDYHVAESGIEALDLLALAADEENPFHITIIADNTPILNLESIVQLIKQNESLEQLKYISLLSEPSTDPEFSHMLATFFDAIAYRPLRESIFFDILTNLERKYCNNTSLDFTNSALNSLAGLNVLLVDDNLINLKIEETMLTEFKCNVITAENGLEAINKIKDKDFHIVFMDLQMPVMNGFDASEEIRKIEKGSGKRLPIVGITVSLTSDEKDNCLKAGMDDFIAKPISERDFKYVVDKYILKNKENV